MQVLTNKTDIDFQSWIEDARLVGGILLIDKEQDWTSFDVVAKLRNLLQVKKVGHAGTLDPLATGLLIVCCGKATKTIAEYQDLPKEYSGVIKLGATTNTDDAEAKEENLTDTSELTLEDIKNEMSQLTGELSQFPPKFSAKKVKGKKLYELARKNIEVEIKPAIVNVHSFELVKFENPYIHFIVKCSKGTYIRSLARDIGQQLGVGGYLHLLRRQAIGDFHVSDALKINEVIALKEKIIL